jgi:hypothetical protein
MVGLLLSFCRTSETNKENRQHENKRAAGLLLVLGADLECPGMKRRDPAKIATAWIVIGKGTRLFLNRI